MEPDIRFEESVSSLQAGCPASQAVQVNQPAYVRIAADLRRRIASGELPAGARLPARQELAEQYEAAEGVVRDATQILIREGHLVSRPGAGTFVRERPKHRVLVRAWHRQRSGGSPFAAEMEAQGRSGRWDYASDTMQAPPEIRERLGLADPVDDEHDAMRTIYVFSTTNDEIWMTSTSWEPLSITKGTDIAFPESGPYGGQGVTHRMAAIGIDVDDWNEDVGARVALPDEARRLGIAAGSLVLVNERTYFAGDQVVEVADVVVPAETTKFRFNGPVGEGGGPR